MASSKTRSGSRGSSRSSSSGSGSRTCSSRRSSPSPSIGYRCLGPHATRRRTRGISRRRARDRHVCRRSRPCSGRRASAERVRDFESSVANLQLAYARRRDSRAEDQQEASRPQESPARRPRGRGDGAAGRGGARLTRLRSASSAAPASTGFSTDVEEVERRHTLRQVRRPRSRSATSAATRVAFLPRHGAPARAACRTACPTGRTSGP